MLSKSAVEETGALPYQDTKPVGAPDFYFGINSTFRFILNRLGEAGLHRYWRELGENYMAPVWQRWSRTGLSGIADYWRAFFAAEPGSVVEVREEEDRVVLDVQVCPAIRHLREHNREIVPIFCQHCYFVSEAAARKAGFTVRVEGGNGSCRQVFHPVATQPSAQQLDDIALATSAMEEPAVREETH